MRFAVAPELTLFAESVRGALAGWEAPLEPAFGTWWDERDEELADRLAAVGWAELWADPSLLGAAVAGGIELGRAVAPICIVDEATLGAPLWVAGRVRHARADGCVALVSGDDRLALAAGEGAEREATLDGSGTVRGVVVSAGEPVDGAAARLRVWGAATLGYVAGLADGALAKAVEHATTREQFGAPLGALPAVQARLADAAVARDGVALVAWAAADPDAGFPRDALAWAPGAAREVTASVLQAHGGIGFALEGGVHRFFRRAKALQVWTDAMLASAAPGGT